MLFIFGLAYFTSFIMGFTILIKRKEIVWVFNQLIEMYYIQLRKNYSTIY